MASQPRIYVTAASGRLGRLVVAALVEQAGPQAVVAIVRDPARAAGLFPPGVEVRQGDYTQPESLDAAFAGADRLLLISSSAVGERVEQHRNAIEAAKRAGVSRIAYTSALAADTSPLGLAEDHRRTEAMIKASGIPSVLLRNGWYTENYTASLPSALQHGAFIGSARDGRISAAPRADYAEAAAAALLADAPDAVYELAGDDAFTMPEFAAEVSRQTGRTIPYVDMPEADYRGALIGAGLPEPVAALLANSDAAVAKGALLNESRQMSRLIKRPTTPYARTIADALKA